MTVFKNILPKQEANHKTLIICHLHSNTDNSKTDNSKTTDSHNSTTNNYYTYSNPASSTNTGNGSTNGKPGSATTNVTGGQDSDTKAADTSQAKDDTDAEVKEDNTAQNVQMPDNIKLDLKGVDVVYEMVDGRSNIEISNSAQAAASQIDVTQAAMESAAVIREQAVPQMAESVTGSTQQKSSAVDWYEIIKIALLVAIVAVVIPKPKRVLKTDDEE